VAPLAGLKVVELARILAGPWAGQTLSDLGADVIKVESPAGDDTRNWGPPFVERDGDTTAAYYHCCNRGKRSIAVDFRTEEGQEQVRALVAEADVLIENFKVGGLEKYGLDYESLAKVNPGLIYCSITGFGQTGPYAKRAGYDVIIQAMSGLMSFTGPADGPPQKTGVAMTDMITGLYGVIAILGAPELASQPEYLTNSDRVANRVTLLEELNALTRQFEMTPLLDAFAKNAVPAGPINDLEKAFADPHLKARGTRLDLDGIPSIRPPFHFSDTDISVGRPSPNLDEHGADIRENGFGKNQS